jgi:hypothetical protein
MFDNSSLTGEDSNPTDIPSGTNPMTPSQVTQKPGFSKLVIREKKGREIARPQFIQETRENADHKIYMQLSKEAQKGAENKISMIDYSTVGVNSKDDSLFKNNVEVETFISRFERHCISFDMVEFFH